MVLLTGVSAMFLGCASVASSPSSEASAPAAYESADQTGHGTAEKRHRDAVLFDWAAELGLRQPLASRDLPQSPGGVGANTGPRTGTPVHAYEREVDRTADLVVSSIRSALTLDEVREYYEQNPGAFARQDVLVILVTDWENGRALPPTELRIDETTVRTVHEADDAVVSAALLLEPGEQVMLPRDDGDFTEIRCVSRVDGGVEPFEDVTQAAAAQLADQLFASELDKRIEATRASAPERNGEDQQ